MAFGRKGLAAWHCWRRGDHAPGTASGVNFDSFPCCGPALNNAGHTAFSARLTGSGVDAANNQSIWSDRSGSLVMVARTGEQAPGAPSGINFRPFGQGLALNDSDRTAFYAGLVGTGVDSTNDESLWSESSAGLALVAREGDHAPGTPSGVVFSFFFGWVVLNDAGQIAFVGTLTGSGVDLNNDKGIWATDRSGQLQLIARKGDVLEVAPGDFRIIQDPTPFSGSTGNSDGNPSFFNNRGQLAFRATFTDGSTGIFVSNRVAVPEPSTVLLLMLATAGRYVSRRSA